jgi:hypothetical protein
MDFHGAVGILILVSAFLQSCVYLAAARIKVIRQGFLHKNLRLRVKSGRRCSISILLSYRNVSRSWKARAASNLPSRSIGTLAEPTSLVIFPQN